MQNFQIHVFPLIICLIDSSMFSLGLIAHFFLVLNSIPFSRCIMVRVFIPLRYLLGSTLRKEFFCKREGNIPHAKAFPRRSRSVGVMPTTKYACCKWISRYWRNAHLCVWGPINPQWTNSRPTACLIQGSICSHCNERGHDEVLGLQVSISTWVLSNNPQNVLIVPFSTIQVTKVNDHTSLWRRARKSLSVYLLRRQKAFLMGIWWQVSGLHVCGELRSGNWVKEEKFLEG